MAYFIRGYEDSRTPVQHSNDIFKEYLRKFELSKLIGKKDSGMPIITDTIKGQAGDKIVYHFIPQNKTDGIYGQNATITGNEESLDEYTDSVKIDQIAKAFKKKGKLTDKRIIFDWRAEAKQQLINWFTDKNNVLTFDALTGYLTNGLDYISDASRSTTALVNGSGRCIRADATDKFVDVAAANTTDSALLSAMTATDVINTTLLDNLVIYAKTANSKYQVAPVRTNSNGKEMYILILSLKAARDLREDETFRKHALSCINAGLSADKDPFISGAIGVWQNIIIMESEFIRDIKDSNKTISRNLLLGANAMVTLWGQTTDYTEEWLDYHRVLGMAADEIRGHKKLTFDGVDQGVIQVPTAVK